MGPRVVAALAICLAVGIGAGPLGGLSTATPLAGQDGVVESDPVRVYSDLASGVAWTAIYIEATDGPALVDGTVKGTWGTRPGTPLPWQEEDSSGKTARYGFFDLRIVSDIGRGPTYQMLVSRLLGYNGEQHRQYYATIDVQGSQLDISHDQWAASGQSGDASYTHPINGLALGVGHHVVLVSNAANVERTIDLTISGAKRVVVEAGPEVSTLRLGADFEGTASASLGAKAVILPIGSGAGAEAWAHKHALVEVKKVLISTFVPAIFASGGAQISYTTPQGTTVATTYGKVSVTGPEIRLHEERARAGLLQHVQATGGPGEWSFGLGEGGCLNVRERFCDAILFTLDMPIETPEVLDTLGV